MSFKTKIILLAGLTLNVIINKCDAQKVLEKSSSVRPAWVYGLEKDFLIVEGVGKTHEQASQNAVMQLKEKIVQSVAVNVSSEVQTSVNEKVMDGLFMYKENTTIKTNISSDFLLALKGVSLNKASAYYWERIRNKDKQQDIHYHVKYPFSEAELNKLIKDWERLDNQLTEEIHLLDKEADNVSSIEKLIVLQKQIEQLQNLVNEPKKTQAGIIKSKIDKIIESLKFEEKKHKPGELVVSLTGFGKNFSGYNVQFSSDCAKLINLNFSPTEESYIVRYDHNFCSPSNSEGIVISTTVGNTMISRTFNVPNIDVAKIELNGKIRLMPGATNNQKWILPLRSFNDFGFKIIRVEIAIERTGQRILSSFSKKGSEPFVQLEMDREFKGIGDYPLEFEIARKTHEVDDMINSVLNQKVTYSASGKIFYHSENSDRQIVYQFEKMPMIVH